MVTFMTDFFPLMVGKEVCLREGKEKKTIMIIHIAAPKKNV